ncbi:MAG: transcriptional repressor LexA [Clostridia bacterium]|nr:transcriptional repressor LexA [Clostridia bacterium]
MDKLTVKERAIYEYIKDTIEKNGYSPSVRDIREALDIKSTSTVHVYIQRLEDKGFISKQGGKSRTLRVGDSASSDGMGIKVPVIGSVTAGLPILAFENHEGYVVCSPKRPIADKSRLFALRVKGESMIEAGILDGDIVIAEQSPTAENGDIVVALIGEEATVKTFYREKGHIRLQPQNRTMKPIITEDVSILGRVISCVRYYE